MYKVLCWFGVHIVPTWEEEKISEISTKFGRCEKCNKVFVK